MKSTLSSAIILGTITAANCFTSPPHHQPLLAPSSTQLFALSRREALATSLVPLVTLATAPADAIDKCPPGSKNCLRQTWTPPSGLSPSDAAAQLREAINAYPQEGQEDGKVDGGGYAVISDALDSSGALAMEFRSSGKGTFAKMFNGGRPFVDDLVIEPGDGVYEFRSASRVGDSDFGVNGKRLSYIGGLLKEKGWTGKGLAN